MSNIHVDLESRSDPFALKALQKQVSLELKQTTHISGYLYISRAAIEAWIHLIDNDSNFDQT